jgi:hypothetical protein
VPSDRKPWYRPRNGFVVAAIAVLGLVGYVVGWALMARANPAVDHHAEVSKLRASLWPETAEGEDAWPLLLRAGAMVLRVRTEVALPPNRESPTTEEFAFFLEMDLPREERERRIDQHEARFKGVRAKEIDYELLHAPDAPDEAGSADDLQRAKRAYALLTELGLFDVLARMAGLPHGRRPRQEGVYTDWQLPDIGIALELARIGVARMHLAHRADNDAELIAAVEANLAVARLISRQMFLLDYLAAAEITTLTCEQVRSLLVARPPSASTCRSLRALFDGRLDIAPVSFALEAERLMMLDLVQHIYTDDGAGSGRLLAAYIKESEYERSVEVRELSLWERLGNIKGFLLPSRAETVAGIEEFFEATRGFGQAGRSALDDADDFYFDYRMSHAGENEQLDSMLPAIGEVLAAAAGERMEITGTRLMIAIELYRATTGAYPDDLAAIVGVVVDAVPDDPLSGTTFGYRQSLPGEDTTGRQYLLYSFGRDGRDNGGQEREGEVNLLALRLKPGPDHVLNRLR